MGGVVRELVERWRGADWWAELAIALILAVLNAASALVDDPNDAGVYGWVPALVAASAGAVLMVRRVAPLATLGAVLVLLTVVSLDGHQTGTTVASLLFASHAVGRWAPGPRGVVGLAAIWVVLAALAASGDRYLSGPVAVFITVIYSLPWLFGRFQLARARDAVADLEEARLAERDRIARELHDIVTHSLTGINVQAATARHLGQTRSEAAETFGRIENASRQALGDLRRMLNLLRDENEVSASPTPGIPDLPQLVATHAEIHGPVSLNVDPAVEAVSPSVGLAIYRVVQEALTNVAKHAAGSSASVTVARRDGSVEVTITNDASDSPPQHGSARGLVGMRERIAHLGGTVHAGPRREGGFDVRVEIPGAP